MNSIRGRLRLGLVVGTVCSFLLVGFVTDQGVRRTLLDDLDQSLRDRGRFIASTLELTADSLELGFTELAWRDSAASARATLLELWREDGSEVFRSPGLAPGPPMSALEPNEERLATEHAPGGRTVRALHKRFIARIDPEYENPPTAPHVDLRLSQDLGHIEGLLLRLRFLLFLVGIAGALALLAVLSWVMRRSLAPLDQLAREIDTIDPEDLSRRVSRSGVPSELDPMVQHLNALLERLQAALERERTFSADIAHELRTPIAGLRSALEVELSQPRDPEQYREALTECLAICVRMQAMVQTLLQLARLDAGQKPGALLASDLTELTRHQLNAHRPRAEARQLRLSVSLGEGIVVSTDPNLLSTALGNLIDNAVSHTDDGGRVCIDLSSDPKGATLRIANTGSRVPSDQVGALFERFARGDAARAAGESHHGLGLALVKRVADVLGLRLEATAERGGEFRVVLHIPRSGES